MTDRTRVRGTHPGLAKAFSLIELLVVIAVLAVLISMLLPSLNSAKELAKTQRCVQNMQALGVGFQQYASNWAGVMPVWPTRPGPGGYATDEWWLMYYPYMTSELPNPEQPPHHPSNRAMWVVGEAVPQFDCVETSGTTYYSFWHGGRQRPRTFDYLAAHYGNSNVMRPGSGGVPRLQNMWSDAFLLIEGWKENVFDTRNAGTEEFKSLPSPPYVFSIQDEGYVKNDSDFPGNKRHNIGYRHNSGSAVLFPDGHARWASTDEYFDGFDINNVEGVYPTNYRIGP
jgi:prepilin-type N-terminal cleavage/methylation domain-containing protein/prepilin-type processing-associated H-X9-DG protein